MAAELQRMEHTGDAPATGVASPIASGDGSFTILNGTGYPTGAVGPFVLCLDPGTAAEEKVLCSARSGTTVTVSGSGRGFDNTSAQSHAVGTTNVQHVLAAIEVDDDNRHVYTTTDDDHTQYARTDGSRAITGTQHFSNQIVVAAGSTITSGGETITAGGLTVTAGGISVAAGTTAVQAVTATTGTFSSTLGVTGAITGSSTVAGTALAASLTGTSGRYVGTTVGAPSSGTYVTGDFATDPTNGTTWYCSSGGTSGTWIQTTDIHARYSLTSGTAMATSATKVVLGTKEWDTANAYSTSSGLFTAPIAGYYKVNAQVAATSGATTQQIFIYLYQNGAAVTQMGSWISTAASQVFYAQINDTIKAAASDTIALYWLSANSLTGAAGSAATFLAIDLLP